MNSDHQRVSPVRVLRLAVITAVFTIACGLPDSITIVVGAVWTLVTG